MTTTAAKNTLLTILAALTIGAFAGGCDDASAPPTLAATDDEAVPDGGAPPTSIMSPSSPANGVESCDGCIVPAGKFGTICVPCE
jgi:hypothetical protein